jgi:DNA-binding response OmpR family regulator
MLPDGDGSLVLQVIRNEKIPTLVAVVSGTGDEQRLAKVRELGPETILSKPLDTKILFGVMK